MEYFFIYVISVVIRAVSTAAGLPAVDWDDSFNKALIAALLNIQNDILKFNHLSSIPVTV
jgi:hypothetical protein